jgi:hypothetical protein
VKRTRNFLRVVGGNKGDCAASVCVISFIFLSSFSFFLSDVCNAGSLMGLFGDQLYPISFETRP